MNTRKNSFFHSFSLSTSRFYEERKAHSSWGVIWPERLIFMIHNPQKLVHMQRRALAAESDYIRKIASSQSSSSLSFSPTRAKRGGSLFSFLLIGHIQLLIPLPPCLGSGWVPNRGKQTAAPLSLDRGDRTRAELLHRKSSQLHADFPSRTSRACSLPKQKTQRLCVSSRWVLIFPHTILNALLVLAIDREKTVLLPDCTLQTDQSVKDEKADDVSSRRHLYCGTPVVTSWAVAGQQVVVFKYLSSRHESR